MLDMFKQDISCSGVSDGNAGVAVSGGIPPYSYTWSTGEESSTIGSLSPGTYLVTVTDSNGTSEFNAVNLADITPMEVELRALDGYCGDLGKITAIVTGGLGPYFYNWSNGSFESEIRDVDQGTYSVVVTDRGNCPIEKEEDVVVNGEGLKLNVSIEKPSCFGDNLSLIHI